MERSGCYGHSQTCWNSPVCSVYWKKQRTSKQKQQKKRIFLKSTVVKQWPPHLVHSSFLLFRYHISPLGSILLLVQQRQVANFLPFNLQQFPCSRRTHTQEEEPRLPWVNWGRGLAKRQWREVKVFWKSHFSGAKAAELKDRIGFASAFTSSHRKQGIKTESSFHAERNQRAEQWHTSHKSSCNNVLFHHFKHPLYLWQRITKR